MVPFAFLKTAGLAVSSTIFVKAETSSSFKLLKVALFYLE
jgi:hypothetical protein